MIIKEITLKNINSFKGQHRFNFLPAKFPLIAITGKTGAGKSTILSAISMALYGNNYKSTINQTDLITTNESSGKISVRFLLNTHEYLAVWECRIKKKNGDLLKVPKVFRGIYLNDVLLEESAEKLLNLNFSDFCRTIILNQGDFSRFLTSSFAERKDILENLVDCTYLSQMTKGLKEKIKNLNLKKDKLEIELSATLPLSVNEYEKIKETNQANQNKLIKENSKYELLTELKKRLNNLITNLELTIVNNQELENIYVELKKSENILQTLKDQEESQKLNLKEKESFYNNIYPKIKEAIQIQYKTNSLNEKIAQNQNLLDDLIQEEKELENQLLENEKKYQECQSLIDENTKKQTIQFNQSINISLLESNELILEKLAQKIISSKTQINNYNKQIKNLKEKEKNVISFLKNKNIDLLDIEIKQIQESKINLQKIKDEKLKIKTDVRNIETQIQGLNQKIADLNNSSKSIEVSRNQIKDKLDTKEKSFFEINEILKKNKEKHEINNCIKKANLDKNCPVCQSEVIKPIQLKDIQNITVSHEEISKIESEIKILSSSFVTKNIQLVENNKNLISLNEELILLENNKSNKTIKINNFSSSLEEDILKTDKFLTRKYQESTQIKENQIKLEEITKELSDLNEKKFLYNKNFTQDLNQSKNIVIKLCKIDLEHLTLEFLQTFLSEIKIQKKILHSKGILNEETGKKVQLSNALKKTNEKKSIANEVLSSSKTIIEELNSKTIDLIGNEDPEKLDQQLKKEIDILRHKINEENHIINKKLIEKNTAYQKIQSKKELIENIQQKIAIEKDFFQNLSLEQLKIIDIDNEINPIDLNLSLLIPYQENVTSILNRVSKQRQDYQNLIIENDTKIKLFEQRTKENLEKKKELNQIIDKLENWNKLFKMIGKDEYRSYVLSVIQNYLINLANIELESLYDGRFQLTQIENTKSYDFFVIDRFRSNELRKVSTLSGGETFLISLAMSLALAEMSRGKGNLDCFFIDEGFGTLDNESILNVVDALYELNKRGKQIGVISHIKHLTDHFPYQIKLEKNNFGNSSLRIKNKDSLETNSVSH